MSREITVYSLDDIKARIEDAIDFYKARIDAWEKVTRVHKKDGKDYAILSHNFTNCKFNSDFGWDRKITVYFKTASEGYTDDYINLPDADEDALTPDEIERKINDLIEDYKQWLENEEHDLGICEEVGTEFITTVYTALKKVEVASADNRSTLYYACRDYMEHLY